MYDVCPHIKVRNTDPGEAAQAITALPDRKVRHLLVCLPPDPPLSKGYSSQITFRMAIQKILAERRKAKARSWRFRKRILLQWLPFVTLAMVLLVGLRRR